VLAMVSVTGGSRQVEVPADKINLGFVLGNKVAFGSVNANREYFETGVKEPVDSGTSIPRVAEETSYAPREGIRNYEEIIRLLTDSKGSIKVYCESRQSRALTPQPQQAKKAIVSRLTREIMLAMCTECCVSEFVGLPSAPRVSGATGRRSSLLLLPFVAPPAELASPL